MPLEKGELKIFHKGCYQHSILNIIFPIISFPMLLCVAIRAQSYKIIFAISCVFSFFMMYLKNHWVVYSTFFTGYFSNSNNSINKSNKSISCFPSENLMNYRSASPSAKSSFSTLKISPTRNYFAAELTGRSLNTGKRAIFFMSPAIYISYVICSASFAFSLFISIFIAAFFRAIYFSFSFTPILSFESIIAHLASVHSKPLFSCMEKNNAII